MLAGSLNWESFEADGAQARKRSHRKSRELCQELTHAKLVVLMSALPTFQEWSE